MTNSPTIRGFTRLWRPCAPGIPCSDHPGRDVEPLAARVLAARGLLSAESSAFLTPSLSTLHDPSLLPNLDAAAERILDALAARQPIVIYGDYDVDGVSATAILCRTLRALDPAAPVSWYIPHRIDEGYGLNADALATLADEGAHVVVTVDCGITAAEPARIARERGIDLIITDHHTPPSDPAAFPRAFALVHPRLPGSAYPFGDLCGAGVAYKLAWRLCTMKCGVSRLPTPLRTLLIDLLSLAALGVIADVVPLMGENRVIARFGLARIKAVPFTGLRALIEESGLGGDRIGAEEVGFTLAPRLNACGRLGHAREALELMLTEDPDLAASVARALTRLNNQRRTVERSIAEQALSLARKRGMDGEGTRAVVLAHEDWHAGVVGIVCSRLVERLCRPTILMQKQGDLLVGSGRSIPGFSLHGALEACAKYLHAFGGHDMAAGVKVLPDRLEAFTEAFIDHANRSLTPADLVSRVEFDCDAPCHELTPVAVRQLDALAPFGQGNPPVRVRVPRLRIAAKPEPFGKNGAHLKFRVGDERRTLTLIAWNWNSRVPETATSIPAGARIDALVVPKVSSWSGAVEPELVDLALT